MKKLNRTEFLRTTIRGLLIAFLAFIALALGSKAVKGNDCSSCPGNGICRGETDCSKY